MARIAIAGFQHETNTFGVTKAGFRDFEIADSWPGLLQGARVISGTESLNLPIAGFVDAAHRDPDIELIPILWCAAEPSAHVTDDAFEQITGMLLDGLRAARPIDGIYLDLHGAMVTETHEDGEGEILRRIRELTGPDLPIAVSLDLHANVTDLMVELATSICIYRTYPHLDMAGTGARCLPLLKAQLAGARPRKAFRQAPFLVPLQAQYTGAEPCRSLYASLEGVEAQPGASADIALGFTAADIRDAGPSVVCYADSQAQADEIADTMMDRLLASEEKFDAHLFDPDEAVRLAMDTVSNKPVVIADVQDNPGAGGTSDTTGLLHALVSQGARGAVVGLMRDPEIADKAHRASTGAVISGSMGSRSKLPGQSPFSGDFLVEALSDGRCAYTGAMYGGGVAELGPSALLRVQDPVAEVQVVVTSQRSQCLDLGLLTHFGLDPAGLRIICVKSTVHFRADFEPIASRIITAAAPGAFPCRLSEVHYQHLRPGMRLAGER